MYMYIQNILTETMALLGCIEVVDYWRACRKESFLSSRMHFEVLPRYATHDPESSVHYQLRRPLDDRDRFKISMRSEGVTSATTVSLEAARRLSIPELFRVLDEKLGVECSSVCAALLPRASHEPELYPCCIARCG
jgi:hypothetical protein